MVFTCKKCGKVFATKSRHKRLFCSERCRELWHLEDNRVPVDVGRSCIHNHGVVCEARDRCQVCGWNPEVSMARFREATAHGAD